MMEYELNDSFSLQDLAEELDQAFYKINIRVSARNSRKSITSIFGLPSGEDHKELLKNLKKSLNCSGHIKDESIIILTGNHSKKLNEYFSIRFPNMQICSS